MSGGIWSMRTGGTLKTERDTQGERHHLLPLLSHDTVISMHINPNYYLFNKKGIYS